MTKKRLHILKKEAAELGLTPYAEFYGDRRQRVTWEKLLEGNEELVPLSKKEIPSPARAQINWKLAIALFIGAIALICLLKPLFSKALPIKITIELGRK